MLQRKPCKIALKSTRTKPIFYRQSLNLTRAFHDFSGKTRLNFLLSEANLLSNQRFFVAQSQIYKLREKLRAKSHLFILAKA